MLAFKGHRIGIWDGIERKFMAFSPGRSFQERCRLFCQARRDLAGAIIVGYVDTSKEMATTPDNGFQACRDLAAGLDHLDRLNEQWRTQHMTDTARGK